MTDADAVALSLAGAGLLLVAIAWLGAAGRLRRNAFVGIRLPSTMRSDAAWYAAHRAGARAVAVTGGLAFAGAVATATWATTSARVKGLLLGTGALMVAGCLVAAVQGVRAARRAGG